VTAGAAEVKLVVLVDELGRVVGVVVSVIEEPMLKSYETLVDSDTKWREEWDLTGMRLAEGGEHLNITVTSHRRNFAHETALTDARRPDQGDHRTVAIDSPVRQTLKGRPLPPPTDQSRLSTHDSAVLVSGALL
jgi:hypothetical protein